MEVWAWTRASLKLHTLVLGLSEGGVTLRITVALFAAEITFALRLRAFTVYIKGNRFLLTSHQDL